MQGLLELAGVPVVGCGVLASAVCMDKARAHALVRDAGMSVPAGFVVDRGRMETALARAGRLGYPLFVKPVRAGLLLWHLQSEPGGGTPSGAGTGFEV